MKKISWLAFMFLLITFCACSKDNNDLQSQAIEAEKRLGGPAYWEISDVTENGKFLVKDKVVLDSTDFEPAEWFKFDTNAKTIEVKYNDEPVTSLFSYLIVGDLFKVYEEGSTTDEDVMTIKSGSVFTDNFTLEQKIDSDIYIIKFVAK